MRFRLISLLLFFICFAFPTYSQELMDMEEDDDEDIVLEDIGANGEEEEYEDYVDETNIEAITSALNDRVRYFDIAGVKLSQSYGEVKEALKEHKYKLVNIEYNIPTYFSYNYDSICRNRNILIPSNLKACIKGLARKDKMEYVSKVDYKKHDTDESISVYFTSPVTNHKVWKIEYKNNLNEKPGMSENFQYQREERRRAFWYFVLNKYGEPNVGTNQWLLDVNDKNNQSLIAGYGTLTLLNQNQNAFDILEASKDARRNFKYTNYTF